MSNTPNYERKDGEGFLNPDKRPNASQDCWTGKITLGGQEYWLNVYEIKTNSKGLYRKAILKPALPSARSAEFRHGEDDRPQPTRSEQRGGGRGRLDDDLPF